MSELNRAEKLMKSIIVKAGIETLKYFGKIGVKYTKADENDVVTEADLKSNRIIVSAIRKNFPNHGIISEEQKDHDAKADYVWIIDPLDGTLNYSKDTPIYGVSIALTYKKDVVVASIYLPYFKELYFARKGKGAYLNGKRIRCSNVKKYVHSMGIIGSIWSRKKNILHNSLIEHSGYGSVWVSSFGSAVFTLCLISSGRRDWTILQNHHIWDIAAGYLIMREAGCIVTKLDGSEWDLECDNMVAANPKLHKELLKITKKL